MNEAENLPHLYERLDEVLQQIGLHAEILFVDDGSTDSGPDWILQKRRVDSRIRLIQLSRNFGHQAAITTGLDRARGHVVIIMDADLQDPPELIHDLLVKWREGGEVVYAVRTRRQGDSLSKRLLAALYYRAFRSLTSFQVPVDTGDFRLLDRKVVDALKSMRETHRYVRAMTSWVGFRQEAVYYERQPRYAGETKYPIWKSLRLAIDGLTSFTGAPLRFVSFLGGLCCLMGFFYLLYILSIRLIIPGRQIAGWASVMVGILFLGGIQLLSLGMMGHYLSRNFEETKKRPLYIVRLDTEEEAGQACPETVMDSKAHNPLYSGKHLS